MSKPVSTREERKKANRQAKRPEHRDKYADKVEDERLHALAEHFNERRNA